MYRIKIVCCALMAIFALGAVASTSASAAELPEFTVVTNGTLSAGEVELTNRTSSMNYKCKSWQGTFTGMTNTTGTFTLDFLECTARIAGITMACKSLGDAFNNPAKPKTGTILSGGSYAMSQVAPHRFMNLTVNQLHIECSNEALTATALLLENGVLLADFTPIGTKTKEFKMEINAKEGKQEFTEWENDSGESVKAALDDSLDGGKEEAIAMNSEPVALTMEKETELAK